MTRRLIFLVFFGSVVHQVIAFDTPEESLEKVSRKYWKDLDIHFAPEKIPDTLNSIISVFNSVYYQDTLKGYACYATSFGCRIGGCPATSEPDPQTYETFDFIVIYSPEINILYIDIINYGGSYGYEICRPKWLKQFYGKTDGFELNKNIDGITGATISAYNLISDLNYMGGSLKKFYSAYNVN